MAAHGIANRMSSVDPLPVRTFRGFLRTFGLIERAMQPYFTQFGITGSQWGVLRNLHRAEQEGRDGLRITELSDRLLIRPPSVTGAVDRLERAGLVVRKGDPSDQRAKFVRLTPAGRKLVDRVLVGHQRQIAALLAGLHENDQAQLHRLLHRLGQHLETLLDGPPARLAVG